MPDKLEQPVQVGQLWLKGAEGLGGLISGQWSVVSWRAGDESWGLEMAAALPP